MNTQVQLTEEQWEFLKLQEQLRTEAVLASLRKETP